MREQIEQLASTMSDAGLGSICEVADGDPPHRPAGCYFQAWSVAEPLRALCEDVLGRQPG
jgi:glycogen debranching enzyme